MIELSWIVVELLPPILIYQPVGHSERHWTFFFSFCFFCRCLELSHCQTLKWYANNWVHLWEKLSVDIAFNPPYNVSWMIRNRWVNCINLVSQLNFVLSHIYKDDNSYADTLINLDLTLIDSTHFTSLPLFLRTYFVKNKFSLPFFKFISSRDF